MDIRTIGLYVMLVSAFYLLFTEWLPGFFGWLGGLPCWRHSVGKYALPSWVKYVLMGLIAWVLGALINALRSA